MDIVIGREEEQSLLAEALNSPAPELLAIYGRRRIGKTFLIRNYFEKQLVFEFSGIHHATLDMQLENFAAALSSSAKSVLPLAAPANWIQAFRILADYLEPMLKKSKKVIFFDEFPWANTHKSGFLPAFEGFWNSWASKQKNLIVVICGSAASWMIQKIIQNKGGLHNRVTKRIRLLPFTLHETEGFLANRKIQLDRYQIIQLYMAIGGVPQYLNEIKTGESATIAIDRICFSRQGILHDEFRNLYQSLFDNANKYIEVVRALARKPSGLTRNEIISLCRLTSGGWATQLIDELTESGFISAYIPFGKQRKDSIYKLTDEYSRFYLKFMENARSAGKGTWAKLSRETSWKSWSGAAFESICLKHTDQIKKALGIEAVYSESSVWRQAGNDKENGAQIDLLIDRQDHCINICEMKFSIDKFTITKSYATSLENKLSVFRANTGTRKTLFLTMVTTFGIFANAYKISLVQNEITMNAFFKT